MEKILKKLTATLFLAAGFTAFAAALPGVTDSPYGVCAHLNRWEYPEMRQELHMMKEARIGFDRTDLDWAQVEPKPGEWNFSRWDAIVGTAEENGIALLPILGGFQPKWGTPFAAHMDHWKTYLTAVVNRYKGRITCWEVINEPDLGEFSGKHAEYAKILKESYDCIKAAAPEAVVTNGGLADMDKVEEFLKLAPPDSFDVLNIHRYYWQDYPEAEFAFLLRGIREKMKQYGHGGKQLWLTETGYSTAPAPDYTGTISAALKKISLDDPSLPIILIDDPEYHYSTECVNLELQSCFREERKVRCITLAEIAKLDPCREPLLLLPANEGFPSKEVKSVVAYLRKGGTVIIPGGGIPFYFDRIRMPDGTITHRAMPDQFYRELHLSWEAWWTNPKAPRGTTLLENAPGIDCGNLFPKSVSRYFGTANLKPGDTMIPLVNAWSKDRTYHAPAAALYRFNSNLKGNIIALSWQDSSHRTTPEWQAKLLPRTFLIAFNSGAAKVFTYSFRSMEHSFPLGREGHFGILRADLTPKPAYTAYSTLTRMRPAGSVDLCLTEKNGIYTAVWKQPSGIPVTAVWTVSRPKDTSFKTTGQLISACDYLGRPVQVMTTGGNVRLTADSGIIYLKGVKPHF